MAYTLRTRIPIKLDSINSMGSGTASRGAMFARAKNICGKRGTIARFLAVGLTRARASGASGPPSSIHIVRIASSLLDSDNLIGSAKLARDEIAEAIGVDDKHFRIAGVVDGRPGIPITYEQRSEGRGIFGCEVVLSWT